MSIPVDGVARTAPASATDNAVPKGAAEAGARTGNSREDARAGPSAVLQVPAPLRFPWLSRLASELEPVAKLKPPFATLPITGDNLDQAV